MSAAQRAPAAHCTGDVIGAAIGSMRAQQVVSDLQVGAAVADVAWLRLAELMATCGKHSPAARAFVVEIAKRAAAAAQEDVPHAVGQFARHQIGAPE